MRQRQARKKERKALRRYFRRTGLAERADCARVVIDNGEGQPVEHYLKPGQVFTVFVSGTVSDHATVLSAEAEAAQLRRTA